MQYTDLEKYFLCGLGSHDKIKNFQVGIYNKDRDSFSFNVNGPYGQIELFSKPTNGGATYVISAICLMEIDDAGLLYKYLNNV